MSSSSQMTEDTLPNQSGRVFFVTGGATHLTENFLLNIAALSPEHIFFTDRDTALADGLVRKIDKIYPNTKITLLVCDMLNPSLDEVEAAATKFCQLSNRLDVLVLNDGPLDVPPPTDWQNRVGYDIRLQDANFNQWLLIKLLLPTLLVTAKNNHVRIVASASLDDRIWSKDTDINSRIDFSPLTIGALDANGQPTSTPGTEVLSAPNKLTSVLYMRALSKLYPSITSISVHPGRLKQVKLHADGVAYRTCVEQESMEWAYLDEGAVPYTQLWAALIADKEDLVNGAYYPYEEQPEAVMLGAKGDGKVKEFLDYVEWYLKRWDVESRI
ncbi:hypothetical protein BT63DRAFT_458490 [Microthyrium microscopicum]|uniref:NAD(P)-binding protein n=1 Tax=Microthyrium microscopicum TaxID=703497 RepID=A0A6A6U374_9PEZI|nr:hypothetical protein BT63DRAFT_458490 [Microthyrium microscopicum]